MPRRISLRRQMRSLSTLSALHKEHERPLACQRAAFPRLSPAVRGARDGNPCYDGRSRTGAQSRKVRTSLGRRYRVSSTLEEKNAPYINSRSGWPNRAKTQALHCINATIQGARNRHKGVASIDLLAISSISGNACVVLRNQPKRREREDHERLEVRRFIRVLRSARRACSPLRRSVRHSTILDLARLDIASP